MFIDTLGSPMIAPLHFALFNLLGTLFLYTLIIFIPIFLLSYLLFRKKDKIKKIFLLSLLFSFFLALIFLVFLLFKLSMVYKNLNIDYSLPARYSK